MERWMIVHGVTTQQEWEAQQPPVKAEPLLDSWDAWHLALRDYQPEGDAQALAEAP